MKLRMIVILMIMSLLPLNLAAHETEQFTHQTETFKRYGGGFMWGGMYRTFVSADETQCRDLIFYHDKLHITEPFNCVYIKETRSIKRLED